MDIYRDYAAIYDAIGQGRFAEALARQVLEWLTTNGYPAPQRVLDLACGTGAATLVFAEAGSTALGVDIAPAMLSAARHKAALRGLDVTFIQADMRALAPQYPNSAGVVPPGDQSALRDASFDLITCFFDSLNYLLEGGDLERVCAGVARLLRPGGHFVFDLNSPAEFATWDECDRVVYDGRDYLVYNRLNYDSRSRLGTGRIVWFVREIDRWWRGEETHCERAWNVQEITAALQQHGLELLACRTPEGAAADELSLRVVYFARRPQL